VDRIVIRPADRRFASLTSASPNAAPTPAPALHALAGKWSDPHNPKTLEIFGVLAAWD